MPVRPDLVGGVFHPVAPVVVELLIQASPFEEVEFVVGVGVAVVDEPVLEGVADLPGGDVVVGDGLGFVGRPRRGASCRLPTLPFGERRRRGVCSTSSRFGGGRVSR